MARVTLRRVVKRYGRTEAVRGISFEVADGELMVILGPSGCGKTSTLRMIAGLEQVTSGTISFDGRPVTTLPPARRNVAMAFENYGLYERWSIYDNIAYPLRLRRMATREISRRVGQIADQLQLRGYLRTRPSDVSGGIRQRVGLARALVRDPSVFLLDEPLSHVDADMRNELRAELKRIHLDTRATMVIVTHDQLDAMTLADRILVMNQGQIEQLDTPDMVYHRPATAFVAGFIGEPPMNLVRATTGSRAGTLSLPGGGRFVLPASHQDAVASASDGVMVGFRPHTVRIGQEHGAGASGLELGGRVYIVEPLGERTLVTVQIDDMLVRIDLAGPAPVAVDDPVRLWVDQRDVQIFDARSGVQLAGSATTRVGNL